MSNVITPTVGRKVWYRPSKHDVIGLGAMYCSAPQDEPAKGKPLDATIIAVWGDRMVNVLVTDVAGKQFPVLSVTLLQDGDEPPKDAEGKVAGRYVEWMPYQKGQNAKADAAVLAKPPVLDPGPDSLEREIQAKASVAPRVTPEAIQAEIAHVEIVKHVSHAGQVLRWAVLTARNGYAVVGRPSVSVSPENDNAEIGERVALENSTEEFWPLLGFRLRDQLSAGQLAAG